jgi:Zn-dependent protease with chaperone function
MVSNLHPKCRIASGAYNFYPACVKHSGKALFVALKMIGWSGTAVGALLVVAFLGKIIFTLILGMVGVLACLWVLFALFFSRSRPDGADR